MPGPQRFLYVALGLLVLLGATRAMEEVDHARAVAAGEEGARRHAIESLRHVEANFRRAERNLLEHAARLAENPAVHRALRSQDEAAAIEVLRAQSIPLSHAVEIHTPRPEALAWRGPGLPLDPSTQRLAFLDTLQSAIVHDGPSRSGLAVWHPVRDEEGLLGAVRVVRLLRVEVPVRNEYLRDLDVVGGWAMERTPVVEVTLEGEPPPSDAPLRHVIESVDGFPLATVAVPHLDAEAIATTRRAAYRNAAAFFAAVLMFWLMFGSVMAAMRVIDVNRRRRDEAGHVVGVTAAAVVLALWWGVRFALLELGVPLRYTGFEALPAFDPAYIGSGIAGGVAGSAVELAITAFFAALSGVWMLVAGLRISARRRRLDRVGDSRPSARLWGLGTVMVGVASVIVVLVAVALIHRATLDATIGYLDRTGPLPEALVTLAFGAFLLVLLGAMLLVAGLTLVGGIRRRGRVIVSMGAAGIAGVATILFPLVPVIVTAIATVIAMMTTIWIERHPHRWRALVGLRGSVAAAVLLSVLTYPIVADALRSRDDVRLMDHIEDFVDGEDPRVAFGLESVLLDARASEPVRQTLTLAAEGQPLDRATADSLAADLVTGSLLAALADYSVGLSLHAPDGETVGRYWDEMPPPSPATEQVTEVPPDPVDFGRLLNLFEEEAGPAGFAVERHAAPDRGSRFVFAGIGPVRLNEDDDPPVGWITARAVPRPARYAAETPFPRVLVPAGLHQATDVVFAEFIDGVLYRSRGANFGRFRLPARVAALEVGGAAWLRDRLEDQPVRVYFERIDDDRVVAVRTPGVTLFDHLFSLLRILTAGLILALVAFLIARLAARSTTTHLTRQRLRDRVLNRFLLVGLLAVGATGIIGREVIAIQNREAVEERLKRQIARVEALLYEEAGGNEADIPPHRILDRARLDVVGHRLGLDVNLYRGTELVGSSRSQLVRQRLIEPRLPIEVVETLFVRGERYAFASEQIGSFEFTTGYEAIPGLDGRPAVVLGIPTLPEQLAIEADQARMTAYLFGVLLLLLFVIFVIATFLANRLTRPFARLREGLQAVGEGHAPAEPIPVESRDEVGEVIETFNAVWDQLEESRRRLAAQERDLAWREMAQQVAHEIKNPLTPMRLSVQHLRRAYERAGEEMPSDPRFAELLDQISGTLIEQIDALNRIAAEFSRLGEMPDRVLERANLNDILTQAAALVGEEPHAEIVLDLAAEPLPVRADREELRRVYINLLKNAQQAMPDGELGLIRISSNLQPATDDAPSRVETRVADTGLGIPEEVRPKVFQPSFSTKTSGMGLGLAIARKTIEDLGGEIDFETETGAGTTFVIRLPLAGDT